VKARAYLLYLVILLICISAFGLPMMLSDSRNQELHSADLLIPNTGNGSVTLTIEPSATIFNTATQPPTATHTSLPTATIVFTATFAPTVTQSLTPTVTPSATRIPPTITNKPRQQATPTLPPTSPPATDPPPTDPPATPVPIIPPLSTLLPLLP
jgi:hypothetical protein